jgi:lysophospholipid acyltransferase (LPLAT)-like uncharacterized protein
MAGTVRRSWRELRSWLDRTVTGRPWFQGLAGRLLVGYFRLVYATARITELTPDISGRFEARRPFIMAIWHGESLMVPFARPVRWPVHAMTSRSKDGGIVAHVLHAVGIEPIRASGRGRGAGPHDVSRRGGVAGLLQARDALKAGGIVTMTADVPKRDAYRAGEGIVTLARLSGAPIVPVAAVCSRHIRFRSWDRIVLALPFGRIALAMGEPVTVAADADDAAREAARQAVEAELNRLHIAAYAAVGRPGAAQTANATAAAIVGGGHG